ncbi:MAG: hypothetical protein LCI00_10700 [Chloroflexi bacterium]|nr:hypothetical protein [Chloroflexota bacterium]MCC6892092.1 hypothetical protein [Anaerolineae bacterium]
MPEQTGTLESIALVLTRFLHPLEERLTAGQMRLLLAELGLQFPPVLDGINSVTNAAQNVVDTVSQLVKLADELIDVIDDENVGAIISKSLEVIDVVRKVIQGIEQFATALKNAGGATGVPAGDLNAFANELPARLLDYLVARNAESITGLAEVLEFTELLERVDGNVGSVDPTKPPFTRRVLHVDRFLSFLRSPLDALQAKYGWGSPAFNGMVLLQTFQKLLTRAGVPAVLDTSVNPPVLDVFFLEISPKTDINPKGLRIRIAEAFTLNNSTPFEQDEWKLEFQINSEIKVGTEIVIQPNDKITFKPPSGQLQGDALVKWTGGTENGEPYVILGQAGGSRVEARQLIVKAGAGFAWNSSAGQAEGSFTVSAEVKKGKIVIDLSQADGFLGTLLSGVGFESDFDIGMGFSTKSGIFFFGSSTLEVKLPVHVSLGPVDINALAISVGFAGTKIPIGLSGDIKASLGPLQAIVEEIGLVANLSFPADRKGNMGAVDFSLGFKPPKGVGLSIDAGPVSGGGYLFFDFEKEEYGGVLQLDLASIVTVTAIGLITTRMPDGSKGFSLLIIITAEFGTGIQLGFGFTLLGVGGLLGLNRTMNLQALAEGVKNGALNNIMFPQDVIANAPRIISDLRTFFPPENGKFLIGPMVKIGWGTPTLISLSLGIIIEIPGNIAIVGVLRLALPTSDAALIVLQVSFIGALEFDKSRVWFFATLFESRVLFFTIEGDMGLLMAFGDDANFVLSVGGFHPAFNPPPLPFPTPRRLAFSIISTPVAKIRVEAYFAVTSNTVQIGAKAELQFGFDAFGVQGHIGFDVLIQFSPFYFIAQISASVSLKVFGMGLFSIRLKFALSGPSGWRAKGEGSLSLLFFEISADFDISWGEKKDTSLPPVKVIPILTGELNKIENWKAELPATNNLLVSLRKLEGANETLVLHPVGTLRISQKSIPLDLGIDKVGNQKPEDAKRFTLEVTVGGLGKSGDASEQFAIAQFQNMEDASKLSRPAYQALNGGVQLSVTGAQYRTGHTVRRVIRYEQIIIDNNYKRFVRRFKFFVFGLFNHFLSGSSIARHELSHQVKMQYQPFKEKVSVKQEGYTVAYQANNKAYATANFASEAAARDFMQQAITDDPNQAETLHVIPQFEVTP